MPKLKWRRFHLRTAVVGMFTAAIILGLNLRHLEEESLPPAMQAYGFVWPSVQKFLPRGSPGIAWHPGMRALEYETSQSLFVLRHEGFAWNLVLSLIIFLLVTAAAEWHFRKRKIVQQDEKPISQT